jgi:hypothetical protein
MGVERQGVGIRQFLDPVVQRFEYGRVLPSEPEDLSQMRAGMGEQAPQSAGRRNGAVSIRTECRSGTRGG